MRREEKPNPPPNRRERVCLRCGKPSSFSVCYDCWKKSKERQQWRRDRGGKKRVGR